MSFDVPFCVSKPPSTCCVIVSKSGAHELACGRQRTTSSLKSLEQSVVIAQRVRDVLEHVFSRLLYGASTMFRRTPQVPSTTMRSACSKSHQ